MVNQVIVRRRRSEEPVFEAISNEGSAPPLSFENSASGIYVPRLGSDDLIYIAAFAKSVGYLVDEFAVVGRHGAPLEERAAELVSASLIGNLASGANYAATIFSREYPGHFVAGLVLTSPDMHSLTVRRLGVIESDLPSLATDFLSSAWKQLQFA
ncbi:hypothetical protein [Salinibacterium sp. NK8237]|uniref:hypothetical protein n=1 Tax=Salinibacterium sp. NK8237 TaxID=2792038 RepID=UPI0018CD95F1|nr:hypothetical protein [Salinibacterium sp. NK8237]MBH0129350.1 hypothetical protein [Salinibacterium sp. NK8237]